MTLICARGLGAAAAEAEFVALLTAAAAAGDLLSGASLHTRYAKAHIPPTTFLANHLLLFCSRLALPALARRLFDEMPLPNVFSHNALLAAHARNPRLALELFGRIPDPDVSPPSRRLLPRTRCVYYRPCAAGALLLTASLNSLMSGYGKGRLLEEVERVFADMGGSVHNHVSWNCMIAVYGQHGHGRKAMELFQGMARQGFTADACTLASVLSAFATAKDMVAGTGLHCRLIKSKFTRDPHVASGLVDLYAKCGSVQDAWKAFSEVDKPDLVLWNTLISGYSLHEDFSEEALLSFRAMQRAGFCPDDCSFVCVTSACSNISSPSQGQQQHGLVIKSDIRSNKISVHNAMITLYSRCGNVNEAKMLFDRMTERNTVSYNSIIAGLAQHGHTAEALKFFEGMLNSEFEPTGITFISVLSACAHTGKVDEGWDYFNSMKQKYDIEPCEEHYSCMIDLLARAKKFEEAEELIMKMPFSLSSVGWTSLLGACRTHGNMELGARAAKEILHLSPSNASAPVMLSNMYASAGKWEETAKIRKLMRDQGIRKKPGCSWIELGRAVHIFVANEVSHPRIKEVHRFLEVMSGKMRLAGYVPDVRWALAKDQAAEGEMRLRHHSEKLAVAFGRSLSEMHTGSIALVMEAAVVENIGENFTRDKVCCMRNEVFLELAWSCQNYFSFLILVALQSEDEFGGHCTLSSA
ncbi:pentatricopeptide repeat-containing protein At3g49710-like [Setaria viridis]|uniref:pentatricopeptide repeat-containing protein At3g49710-like n=1 Tax=Setaria viridis TaxID=4556 RepID=UPI003B3BC9F3